MKKYCLFSIDSQLAITLICALGCLLKKSTTYATNKLVRIICDGQRVKL